MIIGQTKSELINKEPLLKWYFSLFEDVLSRAKKLVVIGYGFGDEHINKAVVKNRDLMIYVICPLEPEHFKANLFSRAPLGQKMWLKIANYYQGDITQLYYAQTQELTSDGVNHFASLRFAERMSTDRTA